MAGAVKHMKRSHRNYGKAVDFKDFERNAAAVRSNKEQKSFFEQIKDKLFKHQSK